MPNHKIQGYDCSVLITGPKGPELVGEYQEAEFSIKEETEEYLGLGERIPSILDGVIKIEGKLKKGHALLDIVNRIWGHSSLKRGSRINIAPRFTITLSIDAPDKGYVGRYRLLDCKIHDLELKAKQGKDVLEEDLAFKAEGIEPIPIHFH
ncbi:hypothetical protein [Desulfofundulus thermosubterraneus]|uniref:Uncharacterized protein n=1 Tax=Desulfofundulus thermosubterraneus DSM 16057 TaxID=1121432 RepID=A0A1M6KN11_9FIRM|nr:hypothetical protein [Desulfofundulus thermosubterraneus]SHJ60307.1 hypothetical protein SAMN02745219_02931 [Desulfofundulus thermosubterraneus DSM 16057]